MTNKIDAMLAPRALTAREVAEVSVNHLIIYGVAHRAFINASVIQDGGDIEQATIYAAESALAGIVDDAVRNLSEWLADVENDGEPRFYRKASVKDAISALCGTVGDRFVRLPDAGAVDQLIGLMDSRDHETLTELVNAS